MTATYSLNHLSREQLDTICAALDMYGRLGLGQLEVVTSILPDLHSGLSITDLWQTETLLRGCKEPLFKLDKHGSLGIDAPGTPMEAKRAFDLIASIASRLPIDPDPTTLFSGRLPGYMSGMAILNWSKESLPLLREEPPAARFSAGVVVGRK